MWRLEGLAGVDFWRDETRICLRAEARVEAEVGNRGSSGAPIWLRWRAKQEQRSGEPFDHVHGSTADRAVPE
jgi:hypothetical protein